MDYTASIIEKIIVERNKKVDSAILGEIQKIADENVICTKIVLNEKNVAEALRNYQDGYAAIRTEYAREIFEEIEKIATSEGAYDYVSIQEIAELKKKYTEN